MSGEEETARLMDADGRFTHQQVERLVRDCGVDPTRRYKISDLEERLKGIDEIVGVDSVSWDIADADDALIVEIYDKKRNIIYHTIARGGRALFTRGADGRLDYSQVYEDLDEALDVFVSQGVPEQIVRKRGAKKGEGGGSKGGASRERPKLAFDQHFMQYIYDNRESMSVEANQLCGDDVRPTMIRSKAELEKILGPTMVSSAAKRDLKVGAMMMRNFIVKHRKVFNRRRVIHANALLERPEIAQMMGRFAVHVKDIAGSAGALYGYCTQTGNALAVYRWFKANRPEGVPVPDLVVALRDYLEQGFRTRSDDEFSRLRKATSWWVAAATAGDYVENNPHMLAEVIPHLRRDDSDAAVRDRNFEAIRAIGKNLTDPDHQYDIRQFKFIIESLQMFGLLEQERVKGKKRGRTPKGVSVEYVQPMSHLMKRYEVYHNELNAAFRRLKGQGVLGNVRLDTVSDCTRFGRRLYAEVKQVKRETVFSHLYSKKQGETTLLADGGSHLNRILTMYVGVNKEYFLENAGR